MYKTLVYTQRQHVRTCTSKTAKITKGDIIQQHINTQSCFVHLLLVVVAVEEVVVVKY